MWKGDVRVRESSNEIVHNGPNDNVFLVRKILLLE